MIQMRTHLSVERIDLLREIPQPTLKDKPRGLWYGMGEEWVQWCRENNFGPGEYLRYEVLLSPNVRLLSLPTVEAMDEFHRRFAVNRTGRKFGWSIPWALVAEEWDGIEISPYQWTRRLDTPVHNWYYSWDVASGCIWRPRDTKAVLVGREVIPSREVYKETEAE